MKIFLVMFVWLFMATVLTTGVVEAVHGTFWILGVGLACFVLAIAKIGCLSH